MGLATARGGCSATARDGSSALRLATHPRRCASRHTLGAEPPTHYHAAHGPPRPPLRYFVGAEPTHPWR